MAAFQFRRHVCPNGCIPSLMPCLSEWLPGHCVEGHTVAVIDMCVGTGEEFLALMASGKKGKRKERGDDEDTARTMGLGGKKRR